MSSDCRSLRPALVTSILIAGLLAAHPRECLAADLQEETVRAYERYVQAAEARMARNDQLPARFLYLESLPQAEQRKIWTNLKSGGVWLDSPDTTDARGRSLSAPDGTLTHWIGAIYFPGANINQVVAVIDDFDHLQDIYKPEIVRSQLLSREGNTAQIFLRIHKDTPWVNPTFNINGTATLTLLDADHARTRLASTRIAQVENAGKPDEHEDSVGHDGGYLWRLNTYWRLEARDGGVIGEWEAITLSREIPFLLRWLVRPFVQRLARQTLRDELTATRQEVERRMHEASSGR
jgi:hypothetical protein